MLGKCKLCLREGVELKNSHYISAAVYRALRDEVPGKNPNPFHLSQGHSIQSSNQDRAHLLCAECELRFSKGGENWFFRHSMKKDGRFKLLDMLKAGQASVLDGATPILYEADKFPAINVDALVYFATSVFWRGSIHGWNDDGSVPVNLHGYADQFRRYLLGERRFPKHAVLQGMIRPPGPVARVTYGPVGCRVAATATTDSRFRASCSCC